MTDTSSALPRHNDADYAQLFMTQPHLHQQLGLERSYGFLLAVASAPNLVLPDEWLKAVWLEAPTQGVSATERKALVGLYNDWQRQKHQTELKLPPWASSTSSMQQFCAGYLAGQDWLDRKSVV